MTTTQRRQTNRELVAQQIANLHTLSDHDLYQIARYSWDEEARDLATAEYAARDAASWARDAARANADLPCTDDQE